MTTNIVSCDCFGFTGRTGPRGVPGLVGAQGPQGKKGDVGHRGPPGIGIPGQAGYPGPAGPPGSAGPPGPAGPYGMAGPQGHLGPQGAQGTIGCQGSIGAQGAQGAMGYQGSVGVGMPGPPGVMGSQGAMGAQGPPGEMGCFNFIAEGADSPSGPASSTAIVKEGDVLRIWSAGGFDVDVQSGSALFNIEPANLIVQDGAPVDSPKDPSRSALYLDRMSGGAIYIWNPTDTNWDQITTGGGIAGPDLSQTGPYLGDTQGNIQPSSGFNDSSGSAGNSTIAGGMNNIASGNSSFVGGGQINVASGDFSAILSGTNAVASGEHSVAIGRNAVATNDGSFVFADGSGLGVSSNADNQLTALMTGGFRFLGGAESEMDGGLVLGGDLIVDGDGSFTGGIMVGGSGTFGGNVDIIGDLVVQGGVNFAGGSIGGTGDSSIPGDLDVGMNLMVEGDGTIGGNLGVTGDGDFGGQLTIGGDGQVGGNLDVGGSLDVTSDGNFGGDVVIGGKLTVGGLIDPTGLILDGQISPPSSLGGSEGLIWVDSGVSPTQLAFRNGDNQDFGIPSNPMVTNLDFAGFDLQNLGNLDVIDAVVIGGQFELGGDAQLAQNLSVGGQIETTTGSTPGFSFTNNNDDGLAHDGISVLSLKVGGDEIITCDSSGDKSCNLKAKPVISSFGANSVTLETNNVLADYTIELPADMGTNGQVLTTNGVDQTTWAEATTDFGNVPDGNVSSPGLAFANETNSGLYRSSAGVLKFAVTGTDILTIADGSVMVDSANFTASSHITANTQVSTPSLVLLNGPSDRVTVSPFNVSGNYTFRLPTNMGSDGQVLTTDGISNTTWATPFDPQALADGSDLAPSLAFANSTGSGLYLKTIQQIGVSVLDREALQINRTSLFVNGSIRLSNNSGNLFTLSASEEIGSSDITMRLPNSSGSNGQVLTTNGSNNLRWTSPVSETTLTTYTMAIQDALGNPATLGPNNNCSFYKIGSLVYVTWQIVLLNRSGMSGGDLARFTLPGAMGGTTFTKHKGEMIFTTANVSIHGYRIAVGERGNNYFVLVNQEDLQDTATVSQLEDGQTYQGTFTYLE